MKGEIAGLCVGFIDCETTGIGERDEPISIGIVAVTVDAKGFGEPFAEWYGEQYPSVPIHPMAQRVHGRSRESLEGLVFDLAGLRVVLDQVDVLVAHNAKFDARMICKIEPTVLLRQWRCSYRQWPWGRMQDKKLDTVCSHFGVERPAVHGAMADAKALMEVALWRTGKTERSRTYLHKLLEKEDFYVKPEGWRRYFAPPVSAPTAIPAAVPLDAVPVEKRAEVVEGWRPISRADIEANDPSKARIARLAHEAKLENIALYGRVAVWVLFVLFLLWVIF